jgi:hypothetical protein
MASIEFVDALLHGWAPHTEGIFDGRSHQGRVALCLDGGCASADVSVEKG